MPRFVDALDAEIADLEAMLEQDPKFMKLRELRRVREIYRSNFPTALVHAAGEVASAIPRQFSGKSLDAVIAAKAYLQDTHHPVPTSDILRHLETLGITFRGNAPRNSLSSLLSKSPDFKANGRSGWTLVKEKADGE